ncbi:MAG: hypothetical protein ACOVN7_15135, partial [Rubrivivax sp.]
METLALDHQGRHVLVLDAPGQVTSLLQAMPVPALHLFEQVVLRGALEALYEGDEGLDLAAECLKAAGFRLEEEDPETIPPFVAWRYVREEAQVAALRMQARCQSAEHVAAALRAQLSTALAQQSGLQARVHALLAESLQAREDHEALLRLLQVQEVKHSHLTKARDVFAQEMADLIAARDALANEKTQLIEQRNQLTAQRDG